MTLDEMIADAEAKRHQVATGQAVVEIDTGDYRTKLRATTVSEIDEYLATLRARRDTPWRPQVGAIGFVF